MEKGLLALAAVVLLLAAGCTQAPAKGTPTQAASSPTTGAAVGTTAPTRAAPTQPSASPAPASSSPPSSQAPSRMSIHGVVLDEALHPLAATVTLLETNATKATGPGGAFRFDNLRPDVYLLTARSAGYRPQTLSVTPDSASQEMKFQLQANPTDAAYNTTIHFRGTIECALEVLILSPSCDTVVTAASGPALFNSTNSVIVDVQDGWKTVVTDVVFDGSAQPLLDGLRVTVQGTHNQSSLGTYQQYGRFNGQQSFTFRLEPGATYPEDTGGPVPENTTAFKFDVFPQSHAWHTVCVPPGDGGTCFLGVGAGMNVDFDLYVTTFYGQPAPDGFTFK